jgi:hypothetical protein
MKIVLFAVASFMLSAGLTARPAWALPCCSACDQYPAPPICKYGCTWTCVDEEPPVARLVYDELAGVCYVVSQPPVAPESHGT